MTAGLVVTHTGQPTRHAVLVLPEPPYPADCGNALRDVQQVALLSRLGYETILVCARPRPPARRRADRRDAPEGVTVRFLSSQAVSECERPLATILRKASYLRPRNAAHPFGWWLRFYEPEHRLPALIRDLDPSAVVLRSVYVQYLPAIRQAVKCPIVVDCHDDDLQLAAEMVRSVPAYRRAGPWANAIGVQSALAHALPLADEVWAVSAADASGLKRLAGGRPVLTVPSGVDEGQVAVASVAGRNGIGAIVANYAYGPNLAGLQWCAARVWPLIRAQVPSAELWLVGDGAGDALARLCQRHPGLRTFGRMPDLYCVYRDAGVMLAPLLQGGGSRLKVVEAWRNGKAVAGTSKGLEGLDAPSDAAAVADNPERLAAAVASLLADQHARLVLGARGREFVASRYAWRAIASTLQHTSVIGRRTAPGEKSNMGAVSRSASWVW